MDMDSFVEQLVKKKKDGKDYLKIVLSIIAAFVLIGVVGLLSSIFPFVGLFMLIIVVGIIYALYILITSTNLEYEYAFTVGELDVDAVINAKRRKRLTGFDINEMEILASKSHSDYNRYMSNPGLKKIYACRDKNADDIYFAVYTENGNGCILLFNPNEKILECFKSMAPRKVFL